MIFSLEQIIATISKAQQVIALLGFIAGLYQGGKRLLSPIIPSMEQSLKKLSEYERDYRSAQRELYGATHPVQKEIAKEKKWRASCLIAKTLRTRTLSTTSSNLIMWVISCLMIYVFLWSARVAPEIAWTSVSMAILTSVVAAYLAFSLLLNVPFGHPIIGIREKWNEYQSKRAHIHLTIPSAMSMLKDEGSCLLFEIEPKDHPKDQRLPKSIRVGDSGIDCVCQLVSEIKEKIADTDQLVFVFSHNGERGVKTVKRLRRNGFSNIYYLGNARFNYSAASELAHLASIWKEEETAHKGITTRPIKNSTTPDAGKMKCIVVLSTTHKAIRKIS